MSDLAIEGAIGDAIEIVTEVSEETARAPGGPKRPNPQLYENSKLAGSEVDRMVDELNGALYGQKKPNLAIEREKPEHRLILLLKLKGLSNREIAKQMGYTEPWVSQICRQPWFQLMLVESLQDTKTEIIDEIVRVEAVNSIYKLVELRDNAKSESVQQTSAIEILNRHLGKTISRTEVSGKVGVEHSITRVDKIDEELAELEAEERRLLSNGTSGPGTAGSDSKS